MLNTMPLSVFSHQVTVTRYHNLKVPKYLFLSILRVKKLRNKLRLFGSKCIFRGISDGKDDAVSRF